MWEGGGKGKLLKRVSSMDLYRERAVEEEIKYIVEK